MTETKQHANQVPPYSMRHVDGVMHLTLHLTPDASPPLAKSVRVQPATYLQAEA